MSNLHENNFAEDVDDGERVERRRIKYVTCVYLSGSHDGKTAMRPKLSYEQANRTSILPEAADTAAGRAGIHLTTIVRRPTNHVQAIIFSYSAMYEPRIPDHIPTSADG